MSAKIIGSMFIVTLATLTACDDTDTESTRTEALALGGLSEEDAERIETENNPDELVSSASPAQSGEGWRRVCAWDLTLKSAPHGAGGALGTLYNGWWFYKTGTDGAWSVGYSYELGLWGWVLSQYLC